MVHEPELASLITKLLHIARSQPREH
jgi:hypothetical protein